MALINIFLRLINRFRAINFKRGVTHLVEKKFSHILAFTGAVPRVRVISRKRKANYDARFLNGAQNGGARALIQISPSCTNGAGKWRGRDILSGMSLIALILTKQTSKWSRISRARTCTAERAFSR